MLITVLILIFALSFPLSANTGSIKVYVKDKKSGEPLESVKISVASQKNASVRYLLETDNKGYAYKTGMQNGVYQLNFDKEGYVPVQNTIRLLVAQDYEMEMAMEALEVMAAQSSIGLVTLAQKLMASGKYEEAAAKVSEAIVKDPEAFILYYNRALAYEKAGDKDKALSDYKKSLELKPDFMLSLSSIANIYARKSEFQEALVYFKKAFDMGCDDTLTLYNYGACLINLGENEQARAVFNKLILLDPGYADAYYQLGIIYLGMDDNAKAKEYLQKFIELEPENSNAAVAREILTTLN